MARGFYKADNYRLRESIGYLLKSTFRSLSEVIESRFTQQGYTFQQWLVLMHLRDGLAGTVAELSRLLRHDSGAMTRLVDQLEERKLVVRRRNAADRRVIELELTPSGSKAVEALIPITVDTLNEALEGFTREEVRVFKDSMRRLTDNLHAMGAHSDADEADA